MIHNVRVLKPVINNEIATPPYYYHFSHTVLEILQVARNDGLEKSLRGALRQAQDRLSDEAIFPRQVTRRR